MTLKEPYNIPAFLNQVKSCNGEVTFTTDEGDILNLKSILSTYIFATLIGNPELIRNGQIFCTEENDYKLLASYLMKTI